MNTLEEIKSSFGNGPIKEFEPQESESSVEREIINVNARIEAIVDLMVSLGFCREQEYNFAISNILELKPYDSEQFDDYLVRRRSNLIKMLNDTGLRNIR